MADTQEIEAEWQRSRPSKLPWIILAVFTLLAGFFLLSLNSSKDDAERQLRTSREQADAMQKKNLELLGQTSALEKRVSDLERENKLLAERKVEPVKPPATPAKPAAKTKAKKKK